MEEAATEELSANALCSSKVEAFSQAVAAGSASTFNCKGNWVANKSLSSLFTSNASVVCLSKLFQKPLD
ncbi:hypothetical protein MANES_12G052001v8 [Manihot esculenta]|uniref:Uncharacterized protein n=1 Tax=Manihot esculenta TaxID=3983 RepID=A0ACB7GQR3_MANES|nr:hypothetical protein MANES_12G052001v8 [Manihot esculenta]